MAIEIIKSTAEKQQEAALADNQNTIRATVLSNVLGPLVAAEHRLAYEAAKRLGKVDKKTGQRPEPPSFNVNVPRAMGLAVQVAGLAILAVYGPPQGQAPGEPVPFLPPAGE